MNPILPLLGVIVVLAGCASQHPPGTNIVNVRGAPPDADNSQSWFPKAFKVGDRRFGTLEDFKAFVVTLPPGSVLRWDSGCIRYEKIPLAHSDATIQEFKDYCKQHGVTFEYIVSGY